MKNDEYKEIKTYEEMSTQEKLKQLDNYEFDQFHNNYYSLYRFLYNLVGVIGYTFFVFFFLALGIIDWIYSESDFDTRVIGSIFIVGSIFVAYHDIKFYKALKEQIKIYRKNKGALVTVQNIGYFFIVLAFINAILIFVISIINNGNNSAINKFIILCPKIMIGEVIFGVILIYTDAIIRLLHKNNKIIKIGKKEKTIDNK